VPYYHATETGTDKSGILAHAEVICSVAPANRARPSAPKLDCRSGEARSLRVNGFRGFIQGAEQMASVWRERNDRGAELRTAQVSRGVLVGIDQLRKYPHLEMHTRGG
jgi:hypothetical protein